MPTINLLYVITKLELGGAQKQLLSLITYLDKRRYNIFLFTAEKGLSIHDALAIEGITINRSKWLERQINPAKDFLALFEIYRFIKKNKIKIVHTHSSKAGILGRLAAKLAKTRVVVHTVHGWSFNDYQTCLWRWVFIWLERITARFTDRLIIVSDFDRQRGLSNHIGTEHKYNLISYGIDYAEFSSMEGQNVRRELGIDTQDLVVGMVACFKPQKSPQDFIKLAHLVHQNLSDVKFILVGDGILRKKIEKLISKFNLQKQVVLTGWRRDISQILSAIDVFVLTSLWEGLPITVLEAIAASRPVVVTNTGGISEVVVEGKMGFLAPPHNMNKMCEKLMGLLKDENLRRQMGEDARHSLNSNFHFETMVKKNAALYSDMIKQKGESYVN